MGNAMKTVLLPGIPIESIMLIPTSIMWHRTAKRMALNVPKILLGLQDFTGSPWFPLHPMATQAGCPATGPISLTQNLHGGALGAFQEREAKIRLLV